MPRFDTIIEGNTSFSTPTVDDAKLAIKRVTLVQKQLRQLKKEINAEMKHIRSMYSAKSSTAGAGTSAVLRLLGNKKAASSSRALAKKRTKLKKERELIPYESVKKSIDHYLLEYDRLKLEFQEKIAKLS